MSFNKIYNEFAQLNCVSSSESLKEYIGFCLDNSLPKKIKGETTSHHILPQAKSLPFKQYKNLIENSWNKSELTYYNHYIAHYLLMKAVPHYTIIYSFCAMHKKDVITGRIDVGELIPENEFTHWFKLRNKISSEYCREIVEIDGITASRSWHNARKRIYTKEILAKMSDRMSGKNNIVHIDGVVDKIRKTKIEKNLDGISSERAAETMKLEFINDDGIATTIYKENGKKISATLLSEFVDDDGSITTLSKIYGKQRSAVRIKQGKKYKLLNVFDPTFELTLYAKEIRNISPGLETKTRDNYLGMSKFGYTRFMERGTPNLIGLFVEELS